MKIPAFILLLVIPFFLNNTQQLKNKIGSIDLNDPNQDTIHKLLNDALSLDTFEYTNFKPFYFIKTGNLLSPNEKNAILISSINNHKYKLELYTLVDEKWSKNDELVGFELFTDQFDFAFIDYNFDGQKDIYIQYSVSNGYALRYGHLFTINMQSQKLEAHPEVSELADIRPDFETKSVYSTKWGGWNIKGDYETVYTLTNKWKNKKLVTVQRKYHRINR